MEKTTLVCVNCNQSFEILTKHLKYGTKVGVNPGKFCSSQCRDTYLRATKTKAATVCCDQCGESFQKGANEIRRSNHNFCSKSCAVSYNNTHKAYGTRRSKLEEYIESRLRLDFPDLELICNGKGAVGSELDFYLPRLRLAIELNGIFHYEPIYGPDKLERIQANDQQKFQSCVAAGIELCMIDVSSVSYATKLIKERYYLIVRDLVVRLLGRAGDTNVQVP